MSRQSRRLAAVQTPVVPTVGRWIAETPGTISLGQGIVSYGPPPEALAAAREFGAGEADHRYGPVEGLPALREMLEAKLARENGIRLAPHSRLVVTAGSNMGFINALLAIVDPGDEVVLPVPYYFNHEMAVVMANALPVLVPTRADYQLDVDAIARAITSRTRAIVTVSPNNPTGVVYPEAALRAVNALCRDRGLFHIHDEAYEYFTYAGARHFSPGSIDDAGAYTFSLQSFSKGYGMASWRVGYMTLPHDLWEAVSKIQDTILVCPPAVSQHAAVAAARVGGDYARARLPGLDRLRLLILEALRQPDVPADVADVDGAFYFLLRIRSAMDPLLLAQRLVKEHRVAVMPGTAFGMTEGCYLRLSYGRLDEASAAEGLARLTRGLRAIVRP
jgi:aspartate/methionine/tyrosine aminotransferase